uniref:TSA: Wollemia nobilis Ref_Wollemi_Transcript_29242_1275 transcribed RNA sequence n=1 Tax=Wollemia nobilis TaxID=56998 RepID=A0A0C9S0Q5_9CONI
MFLSSSSTFSANVNTNTYHAILQRQVLYNGNPKYPYSFKYNRQQQARIHALPFSREIWSRSQSHSLCLIRREDRNGHRGTQKFRCAAAEPPAPNGNEGKGPSNGTNNNGGAAISKTRREMLLEYVRTVQPEFLELFIKRAPPQVVEAMRQTVTNMIGTLPPQFFAVTVTTVAENLAQLMYSVMMTGYMFKNAQYRLELQRSLEQVALTDGKSTKSDPDYAPGAQKKSKR